MAKKPRYFLHLAYKGTNYRGWQVQAKGRSVQGELERCLSALLHAPKKVHPCGRTDAGVHASQFFAHLEKEGEIDFDLVFRINKMLPNDIVVYDMIDMIPNAHAQLDAISRTYLYKVHRRKNPFWEEGSTWFPAENLDLDLIRKAMLILQKYEDFRSMCLTPEKHSSTICQFQKVELTTAMNEEQLCFELTANRFLRGMVRLLVARFLDIGTGKLSLDAFEASLKTGNRVRFHTLAPPQGLYLAKVEYPYLKVAPRMF